MSDHRPAGRDPLVAGAASSTRSTPAPSPTPTVTGSATCPGSSTASTTSQWLGVDGIWLSPITVSPNADWGYDVADYHGGRPDLGTLDDVDRLIAEAGPAGHPGADGPGPQPHQRASTPGSSTPGRRGRPSIATGTCGPTPRPTARRPTTGCPASADRPGRSTRTPGSTTSTTTCAEQPDLNWWNEEVRAAFDDILAFWLDRGVAGFRIDVCNMIIKDAELRDNPPATEADTFEEQLFGQRSVYNANRPEVHEVLRRWRAADRRVPGAGAARGDAGASTMEALAAYYGTGGDELHLAFNFPFINSPFDAGAMRAIVEDTERASARRGLAGVDRIQPRHVPVRHPVGRGRRRPRPGSALLMLLCLRGTPVLYQGDEIGQPDTDVPHDRMRDPLGVLYWPAYAGRDAMRTPMPWRDGPGGGFTEPGVEPWLPFGRPPACNVEAQRDDPASMLTLARDLIALRRATPELQAGPYRSLEAHAGSLGLEPGRRVVVVARHVRRRGTARGVSRARCCSAPTGAATVSRSTGPSGCGDGRRWWSSARPGDGAGIARPRRTGSSGRAGNQWPLSAQAGPGRRGQPRRARRPGGGGSPGSPRRGEVAERGGEDPARTFGEAPRQRVAGPGAAGPPPGASRPSSPVGRPAAPGRRGAGRGTGTPRRASARSGRGGRRPGGSGSTHVQVHPGSRGGRRTGPRPAARTPPIRSRRRWPSGWPPPRSPGPHPVEQCGPLRRRPRGLPDGEQGHHPGRGQRRGVEGAHVGDPGEGEPGRLGQLGHGGGRLVEHPVHPGRPVAVGRHLGHVQQGRGRPSADPTVGVSAAAGCRPVPCAHDPAHDRAPHRRHDRPGPGPLARVRPSGPGAAGRMHRGQRGPAPRAATVAPGPRPRASWRPAPAMPASPRTGPAGGRLVARCATRSCPTRRPG